MKGKGLIVNLVDLQETKLTAMQITPRVNQGPEFAAEQAADPALEPLFQQAASADPQFRMRGGLLNHIVKKANRINWLCQLPGKRSYCTSIIMV